MGSSEHRNCEGGQRVPVSVVVWDLGMGVSTDKVKHKLVALYAELCATEDEGNGVLPAWLIAYGGICAGQRPHVLFSDYSSNYGECISDAIASINGTAKGTPKCVSPCCRFASVILLVALPYLIV